MKKTLIMLLVAVLLFTACTTTENSEDPVVTGESTQPKVTEMPVATTNAPTPTPTPNIPPQIELHCDYTMPEPFGHQGGGDGHGNFVHWGNDKFMSIPSSFFDRFDEYLGEKELITEWGVWERREYVDSVFPYVTGIMDFQNMYSLAVVNDIPIEILIEAIDESNELTAEIAMRLHGIVVSEDEYLYTKEDIAALLTRDEATVLAHFASPYAIVIHDRVYTPAWIYRNTIEGYRAAGITPAMIQEKLPLWQEFGFTDEARTAFEGKLTEFVGAEVSFAEIARDSGVAQSRS